MPTSGEHVERHGRRVTIYDVARVAGVSSGTVSRVLNGRRGASVTARKAVERALVTTGYVPNYHARRLAGVRLDTVAFLHCVGLDQLFADANINGLMLGCNRALNEHDIMQVVPVNLDASAANFSRASRDVDAALVFSAPTGSAVVADLVDRGLPLVSCGAPIGHEGAVSYVSGDDRAGAQQIVSYLRSRGRRRIATVTGPLELASGSQRLAGYRDALDSFDPVLVTHGDYTFAGGAAAVGQLLRRAPDLDALFVASDAMAAGALATLEQAGRRVPEDVAVAGFDDAPIAAASSPQLTTVRVPWPRIADELVRQLLRRLDGDGPSGVILPVDLALRGTA